MSLIAHVKMLEVRKSELENQIATECTRPMPNFALVSELKRKKLRVKEKIYALVTQRPEAQDCA